MKVLITGAAGFIGSHMAERLAGKDVQVVGIDNFSDYYDPALKRRNASDGKAAGVDIMTMDLTHTEDYTRLDHDFDFIIHFAAQPGISAHSTFDSYLNNNFVGTQNLLEYAEKLPGLQHFFNISTSSVYGTYARKSEDNAPEPTSYYGVTKLAAEQLVLARSRKDRLKASSLRLYSVYGPRERPDKMYTRLIKAGLEGSAFPLYEGSLAHKRSFTFVGDIVDGIALAVEKHAGLNGEVINLGHYEQHSTKEGIEAVEEALHTKIRIENRPPRDGDQLETSADITKARRLLGYEPTTDLKTGILKQIEWYRQNFVRDEG